MSVSARQKRLFGVIIGNPPYQGERVGQRKKAPSIYHKFMDAAYEISDKTILITPARFLFNAGATPKAWNRKMLDDEHLRVVKRWPNSDDVFPGTDIKGGVAVTYRDVNRIFGPIGTFTAYPVLDSILSKISQVSPIGLHTIFKPQTKINYAIDSEYPGERRIVSDYFDRFPDVFVLKMDALHTVEIKGLTEGNRRTQRFVDKSIIDDPLIDSYKVIIPKANGSGALGEVLSTPMIGKPMIGKPMIGYTQTFIAAGPFATWDEARACLKYIKTKFARAMLGVLKVTQSNAAFTWAKVPLQDFTDKSDIDWTQSVADIDQQLYAKYGLDQHEIDFIETHVKEMP